MSNQKKDYGLQVQIRLDKDLAERLDRYRKLAYRSRSSIINEALARFLDKRKKEK